MESTKELQSKKDSLLKQLKEVDDKLKTLEERQKYTEGLFTHDILSNLESTMKPYLLIIESDVHSKKSTKEIYRCGSETEMIDRLHEIIDSAHAMIKHIQTVNGIEDTDVPSENVSPPTGIGTWDYI